MPGFLTLPVGSIPFLESFPRKPRNLEATSPWGEPVLFRGGGSTVAGTPVLVGSSYPIPILRPGLQNGLPERPKSPLLARLPQAGPPPCGPCPWGASGPRGMYCNPSILVRVKPNDYRVAIMIIDYGYGTELTAWLTRALRGVTGVTSRLRRLMWSACRDGWPPQAGGDYLRKVLWR
jgi:hypothetical protein